MLTHLSEEFLRLKPYSHVWIEKLGFDAYCRICGAPGQSHRTDNMERYTLKCKSAWDKLPAFEQHKWLYKMKAEPREGNGPVEEWLRMKEESRLKNRR